MSAEIVLNILPSKYSFLYVFVLASQFGDHFYESFFH
jgi:hypothetical protein